MDRGYEIRNLMGEVQQVKKACNSLIATLDARAVRKSEDFNQRIARERLEQRRRDEGVPCRSCGAPSLGGACDRCLSSHLKKVREQALADIGGQSYESKMARLRPG